MKAILSIKPEYVTQILDGRKTYEFRRRIFKRPDVDTIVIYCTSPQSVVVAEASIDKVLESTPRHVWEQTHEHGGISRDKFMAYFRGADIAYAIKFKTVTPLSAPQQLSEYAPTVKAAPQSFVYVD